MKSERTPRTLADCDFSVGYPEPQPSKRDDVLFAVVCGMVVGALLVIALAGG